MLRTSPASAGAGRASLRAIPGRGRGQAVPGPSRRHPRAGGDPEIIGRKLSQLALGSRRRGNDAAADMAFHRRKPVPSQIPGPGCRRENQRKSSGTPTPAPLHRPSPARGRARRDHRYRWSARTRCAGPAGPWDRAECPAPRLRAPASVSCV